MAPNVRMNYPISFLFVINFIFQYMKRKFKAHNSKTRHNHLYVFVDKFRFVYYAFRTKRYSHWATPFSNYTIINTNNYDCRSLCACCARVCVCSFAMMFYTFDCRAWLLTFQSQYVVFILSSSSTREKEQNGWVKGAVTNKVVKYNANCVYTVYMCVFFYVRQLTFFSIVLFVWNFMNIFLFNWCVENSFSNKKWSKFQFVVYDKIVLIFVEWK